MIRDPSDGSEFGTAPDANEINKVVGKKPVAGTTPSSANNWGLKSLDRPERKPKPAPTVEELRQHYAKFKLAFEPKEST